jgi:hypothetical protein
MTAGQLFYDAFPRPLSSTGTSLPLGYYNFYVSGTTTPASVYQDAGITTPYPAISLSFLSSNALYDAIQADATGTFQPIFLNPQTIYRVQLYNQFGSLIEDVDPYVPPLPGYGNGPITQNAQGEITIAPPAVGGTGITVSIYPRSGAQALLLQGLTAGNPIVTINNAVTTGTNTATFAATNKPGSANTSPSKWLPVVCDGSTFYLPLWQ